MNFLSARDVLFFPITYREIQISSWNSLLSQVISGQQFPKPKGSTAKGDVSVTVVVAENVL